MGSPTRPLARPKSGFGEEEFYPSLEAKAEALLDGILRNHPFVDGDKRLALLATLQARLVTARPGGTSPWGRAAEPLCPRRYGPGTFPMALPPE